MRTPTAVLLALAVAGCSNPIEADVRSAFLSAYPGARVQSLTVGEGDDDHAYYRIRFRAAGDTVLREAEWLYTQQADGSWRNTHRGASRPAVAGP
jgi:hypothetical protein